VQGRPWGGRPGHNPVPAASLAAALLFAASLAAAVEGLYPLAVGLWMLSGSAAAAVVSRFYRFYEGARWAASAALEAVGEKPPRPMLGYWTAVAAVVPAPPLAGLFSLALAEAMVGLAESAYAAAGGEADRVVEGFAGRVPDPAPAAALAAVPLLLPAAAAQLERALQSLLCLVYMLAARAAPGRLGDKPCLPDLVDLVVWGQGLGLTPDLQAATEKWSIKD